MTKRTIKKFDDKLNTILQNQIIMFGALNEISERKELKQSTRKMMIAMIDDSISQMEGN